MKTITIPSGIEAKGRNGIFNAVTANVFIFAPLPGETQHFIQIEIYSKRTDGSAPIRIEGKAGDIQHFLGELMQSVNCSISEELFRYMETQTWRQEETRTYDGEDELTAGISVRYRNNETGNWSCCSRETMPEYADLICTCYARRGDTLPYGYAICYENVYRVELAASKLMYASLAKITKKMDLMSLHEGASLTFGAYAAHFARAIRAKKILFWNSSQASADCRVEDMRYLAHAIDLEIQSWLRR